MGVAAGRGDVVSAAGRALLCEWWSGAVEDVLDVARSEESRADVTGSVRCGGAGGASVNSHLGGTGMVNVFNGAAPSEKPGAEEAGDDDTCSGRAEDGA